MRECWVFVILQNDKGSGLDLNYSWIRNEISLVKSWRDIKKNHALGLFRNMMQINFTDMI